MSGIRQSAASRCYRRPFSRAMLWRAAHSVAVSSVSYTTSSPTAVQPLPFEPLPAIYGGVMQNEAELAKCHGKRIGILIVAFNAVTTLAKVLKRITPNVWQNVEEVAVFDDASQDATYEL